MNITITLKHRMHAPPPPPPPSALLFVQRCGSGRSMVSTITHSYAANEMKVMTTRIRTHIYYQVRAIHNTSPMSTHASANISSARIQFKPKPLATHVHHHVDEDCKRRRHKIETLDQMVSAAVTDCTTFPKRNWKSNHCVA